jgi:hypothetical protein
MSHIIYTHISVTSMDTIGKKFVGSWIIERSAVVAPAFFFFRTLSSEDRMALKQAK